MLKQWKTRNKIVAVIACSLCVALIVVLAIALRSEKSKPLTVLDGNGDILATVSDLSLNNFEMKNEAQKAYIEIALKEAVEIIAKEKNCSEEKSEKMLGEDGYVIYTAFDAKAFEACNEAYKAFNDSDTPFSTVVMTNEGQLLSAFCSSQGSENYVIEKTQPYSAFKPLSVYAPALEKGLIDWSSQYEDSPVKKVQSDSGEYVDWPVNGTGKYTYGNISVCEGVKLSLNTTAVRCLTDLGVINSIKFLSENFGIDCSNEERIVAMRGEEEVLANIGLGYLTAGVSPLKLTGCYTIFANGGKYEEPYAILKIENQKDGIVFEHKSNEKQVISEETAYIMNKLLQNTLSEGGTAEKAKVDGVKIGGKTGTGSELLGNWFVGFTPEYCYSVWHGQREKNVCAEVSSFLISGLEHNASENFPACPKVTELPYCTESGDRLTFNCKYMETGFYSAKKLPQKCKMHSETERKEELF